MERSNNKAAVMFYLVLVILVQHSSGLDMSNIGDQVQNQAKNIPCYAGCIGACTKKHHGFMGKSWCSAECMMKCHGHGDSRTAANLQSLHSTKNYIPNARDDDIQT
ncbi:PREDICTED: uncharacterized protein LOC101299597 [Fragaria vesca subsp. vesca]|uniref:uncharacterized protein LOC101299597 n=1 Tax=Fragaria vesca subsp. vesca TaxID=101020 RepID=UPI0002C2E1CB|nr:PREDICTED: uncharacterized protein LOC101299597 [Fragaria vesca subsp. vesca]